MTVATIHDICGEQVADLRAWEFAHEANPQIGSLPQWRLFEESAPATAGAPFLH